MKKQICLSLDAVKQKLALDKGQFELFGYDFLIDADLKAWMIEVNTNPCLEESCTILKAYLYRMVNDALKLTIDLAFPPRKGMQPYKPNELNVYHVDGYPDDANMWDLVMQLAPQPKTQNGSFLDRSQVPESPMKSGPNGKSNTMLPAVTQAD